MKPFAFSELLARVRSLLRRGQAKAPEVLRVADMELDLYPKCGGAMRIIACITDRTTVRDILLTLGQPIAPPTILPARGPPLWAAQDDAASDAAARRHLPAREHSRPTRSGLRLRSAPRLVVRLPRAPPWRRVGPARAGRGQRPQACSPAPHCRAVDPEICRTTAWAEDRRRSLAA